MLSVIVPAYNEENAIVETIQQIDLVIQSLKIEKYEIIIVDDGSQDKTRERALSQPAVSVISHPHNVGYGRSLKDGIAAAKYETIVITDADKTYPFESLNTLLTEYVKGFDMVVGARSGQFYKESFIKAPLRKVLKFLVEFTTGRKIPDINSGFRIFNRNTVIPYFSHLCDTFSFTTSVTLAYMMTGKFVSYVPIEYHQREGKTKVKLFRDALRTMQYILQAINYYNPIKLFILFSCFCIVCSVFGFLGSAVFGLRSGFLLGVGGLLVSLNTICFGLVADLLRQIMQKNDR